MIQNNIPPIHIQPAPQNVLFVQRNELPVETSCFQRFLQSLKACCCSSPQRRQVRPAVQLPPGQIQQQNSPPIQPYVPPAEISRIASAFASGSQHPHHNSQNSKGQVRQASQSQPSGFVSGRSNIHSLSLAAQAKESN